MISCCLKVGAFFLLSSDPGPRRTGYDRFGKVCYKMDGLFQARLQSKDGVREGRFLPEIEFLKSPSPSFFPKMVGGGIKSQRELQNALCQGDRAALLRRGVASGSPLLGEGHGKLIPRPEAGRWAEAWLALNSLRGFF